VFNLKLSFGLISHAELVISALLEQQTLWFQEAIIQNRELLRMLQVCAQLVSIVLRVQSDPRCTLAISTLGSRRLRIAQLILNAAHQPFVQLANIASKAS
jgi:hypothetical protein